MKNFLVTLFAVILSIGIFSCGGSTSTGGGSTTLTSIAVTPATPSVFIGGTRQFTATGTYSDSTTADITTSVTWSSSNAAVATIGSTGLATGVAVGTTTITATLGVSGTTTLTTTQAAAGKIAFLSYRDDDSAQIYQLYVMDTDGSNQTRLSTSGNTESPLWSPDASQIVFTSWRDNLNELYIVNVDGTGEAVLTPKLSYADWNDEAAWSANGTKIAFTSYRTGHTQIYTMNADGSSQTRISNATHASLGSLTFTNPSWSPDGSQVTADTHWFSTSPDDAGGIYSFASGVLNAGTQLTHDASDYKSVWSPNGNQIAFYRQNSSANPTGADIYIMSSDGSSETKLVEGINPIWSPDGTKIAFLRDDTGFKLYVMKADGTEVTNLMTGFDNLGVSWTPSWSTDGSQLVFADSGEIYIINSDATGLVKVTTGALASSPMWSPQ